MTDAPLRPITVTGDITADWAIVAPPEAEVNLQAAYLWERGGGVSICAMPGGAAMIASLLADLGAADVAAPVMPEAALSDPRSTSVTRTFTTWARFPELVGGSNQVWRPRDFLGRATASGVSTGAAVTPRPIVVIDDANLGFRDDVAHWESLIEGAGGISMVFLKMAAPIGAGPLWERLRGALAGRVTIYLSLGDLRKEDAAIGQALSWERTASEVVAAVRRRTDLNAAARVVVGLGLSGAVAVSPGGPAWLVYDPSHLEGDWEAKHPGSPYGTGSAVVAAMAFAWRTPGADTTNAIAGGLGLARALHGQGLTVDADGSTRFSIPRSFAMDEAAGRFCVSQVPEEPEWSLLGLKASGEFHRMAEKVLFEGVEPAASGIPIERMGAWASVDRAEIESIRSVRNIAREYLGQAAPGRPLCIAVFGPPGAGKSFAIKQMASQWAKDGRRIEALEFNVSQFTDDAALAAAFQRVRDAAVTGSLPVVFWDEFDSVRDGRKLGWLARFLAPMQDGAFFEGSLVRPIGPAIFVFAGGTHATMESFKTCAEKVTDAKATDFLSRLRGYVDVLGPNRAVGGDDSFAVRRAFLLRQILQRRAPQLDGPGGMSVDPGVANAFLSVERYVHGARSMESIVEMSALAGRTRFARSSLPAAHQLSLHVDASAFLKLLDGR